MRTLTRSAILIVGAALAVLAAATGTTLFLSPGDEHPPKTHTPPPIFPGGGRLLIADAHGIHWLFAEGQEQRVGPYVGADLFPRGDRLLAWKLTREDPDYFVTTASGASPRHVLPPPAHQSLFGVQVSPNGRRVAYFLSSPANSPRADLVVMNLRTERKIHLGLVGPAERNFIFEYKYAWHDDSMHVLVQSDDGTAVESIGGLSFSQKRYLSLADVASAYKDAQPGAGFPARIRPIGWSPDPSFHALATLVSDSPPRRPAVVVLKRNGSVAFAASHFPRHVTFQWAPAGSRFLLTISRDTRAGPRNWSAFVGDARKGEMRRIFHARSLLAPPLISPNGRVVLYAPGKGHRWRFASADLHRCPLTRWCNPKHVVTMDARGYPVAWGD